jgi:hypothetical protein
MPELSIELGDEAQQEVAAAQVEYGGHAWSAARRRYVKAKIQSLVISAQLFEMSRISVTATMSANRAEIGIEPVSILKATTMPRQAGSEYILCHSSDENSFSFRFLATLDERFQKVDTLCQRMEKMMAKFDEVVGSLEFLRHPETSNTKHP